MADINVVAENLAELLTNTVNMTDVFYDMFINPTPMDITLYQYNTENELVPVVVPNRAKDRQIALTGTVAPTSSTDTKVQNAAVGTCYVNTTDDSVYFRVRESGNNLWIKVSTQDDIDTAISTLMATIAATYVPLTRTINGKALSSNITLTNTDIGSMSSDVKYGASLAYNNSILSLKDQDGATLSTADLSSGASSFADTALSNLSANGEYKLEAIKGYQTGNVALDDATLYSFIKNLYDASSTTGTDYYEVDDSTISIPYTLLSTGSKVVLSTYAERVEDVYDDKGYALYYILDTTSETVTLPKGEIFGFISNSFKSIDEEAGGEWFSLNSVEVANDITVGTTATQISIAQILPNDGYEYMIQFDINHKSSSAGIAVAVSGSVYNFAWSSRNPVADVLGGCGGLTIVGTDRKLLLWTPSKTTLVTGLYLHSARRLGRKQ